MDNFERFLHARLRRLVEMTAYGCTRIARGVRFAWLRAFASTMSAEYSTVSKAAENGVSLSPKAVKMGVETGNSRFAADGSLFRINDQGGKPNVARICAHFNRLSV